MARRRLACGLALLASSICWSHGRAEERPNILLAMADDWGWPHAGAYGDPVVQTPTFDRLAREGVLFRNAFVAAPSCTPSRNAVLTGEWHWRLGQGGNLWSTLHPKYPTYPKLLARAGYYVGHSQKAWGPGNWRYLGRKEDPVGARYEDFAQFFRQRPRDKPFCFWLGTSDPHRPYRFGSGTESGIDLAKVKPPADLPGHDTVRSDVADYYFEVQRFDKDVGAALALLEATDELENTIVVMTGDHGMPFPRHKCNLYDSGTHVCLAIRWGAKIKPGRLVTDFVSLIDLAPTFLEVAGAVKPAHMIGRSLLPILSAEGSGRIDASRDYVLTGRERHVPAQEKPSIVGYPSRAFRTDRYLYIRNFHPERWPAGAPLNSTLGRLYADCDESPTKTFLLEHRDHPQYRKYFKLAFAKRPAEELYDLESDPDQLENIADQSRFAALKAQLSHQLREALRRAGDPRIAGNANAFDRYPYRPGLRGELIRQ